MVVCWWVQREIREHSDLITPPPLKPLFLLRDLGRRSSCIAILISVRQLTSLPLVRKSRVHILMAGIKTDPAHQWQLHMSLALPVCYAQRTQITPTKKFRKSSSPLQSRFLSVFSLVQARLTHTLHLLLQQRSLHRLTRIRCLRKLWGPIILEISKFSAVPEDLDLLSTGWNMGSEKYRIYGFLWDPRIRNRNLMSVCTSGTLPT